MDFARRVFPYFSGKKEVFGASYPLGLVGTKTIIHLSDGEEW